MNDIFRIDVCMQKNARNGDIEQLVNDSIAYWAGVKDFRLVSRNTSGPDAIQVMEGSNQSGSYTENWDTMPYDKGEAGSGYMVVLVYKKP